MWLREPTGVRSLSQHSINSADETEYHLLVARDYGLLTAREWSQRTADVSQIRAMTMNLRRKILSDLEKEKEKEL